MKKLFPLAIAAIAAAGLVSCDDNNEPKLPDADHPTVSQGLYVLDQGNYYNGIEGSLNVVDYNSTSTMRNVFRTANNRSLGATPQCGVAYGSKIYLGIYESSTIEVINRSDYKSAKQFILDGTEQPGTQPRSMVATGGKIYISMYNGYVSRLDTLTMTIDASVKVGPNPEIMGLYNNKLYVPNSDGMNYASGVYGKTASEIDLSSFTVTRTFEVPENPAQFIPTSRGLYLLSKGNYGDTSSALYRIKSDLSYEKVADATIAASCGNYICFVNDPYYGSGVADYRRLNLATGEVTVWNIEHPEYATEIFYDELAQRIAINSLRKYDAPYPNYDRDGYVAIYDTNGNHIADYATGVGPACMFSNNE